MKALFFCFLSGWLVTACYYKDETDITVTPIGNSEEISFSSQVLPIFNASCSLPNCHVSGGHDPNLEAGSAYTELISKSLVNTQNPESSELLVRMRSISDPMPTSGKLSNAQINIIAAWIAQGAKNN